MKLAILSTQYPSEENHYAHTFVHRRSKYFIESGEEVTVFVPSVESQQYIYEGVRVIMAPSSDISKLLTAFDVVYFHLLNLYPFSARNGYEIYDSVIKSNIKSAFYIHGSEVQTMASRNFDFKYSLYEFLRILYKDCYFIYNMRRIVRKLINNNCKFITPSNWMLHEARNELKIPNLNATIIPNGIDTDLFNSKNKSFNNCKMLMIRPLHSYKYAVDIGIEIMRHLPEQFTLDIYGKGKYKNKYIDLINLYHLSERVKFVGDHIPNHEMPNIINKYDYFLSPTRMDAQGVSMCEALSCGRIVISSNNTAIPEFIHDGLNGILADTPESAANKIVNIENDKLAKEKMMHEARVSAKKIAFSQTLKKELLLLRALKDGEVTC
ncbi:glycosyltransferase family 4 protein [Vibrio cholerae]|uniref:glycosyltransferase family 4 protein n=1 Tax=Vibrio cholerae TaxID=666 RepID=UPI0030807F08